MLRAAYLGQASLSQGGSNVHAILGAGVFIRGFVKGILRSGFDTVCFGPIHGQHGIPAIATKYQAGAA
jgi:hypothetical protein